MRESPNEFARETQTQSAAEVVELEHGHPSVQYHNAKPWDPFCKDCGAKNEEFKDETVCENCERSTGSIATAKLLDSCPGCGSKDLKVKGAYVACTDCGEPLGKTKSEAERLESCPRCGNRRAEWRGKK